MDPKNGKRPRRSLARVIQAIFDLDPSIRFVAVYQDQYLLAGGMRKGTASLDSEEDARNIDLQLSKIGNIAKSWQRWFGILELLVLQYQKLNLVFLPIEEERFLILSSGTETDPLLIVRRLKESRSLQSLGEAIP